MIKPDRYTNPTLSAVNVAGCLLKALKESGYISLPEAETLISSQVGMDAVPNLMPAVNLLYLLDVLSYNPDLDALISTRFAGLP